ncbi:hypothetical protein [Pinibacter aurantiacus]|uniref:Uncharacterized protein n=1 Tax=Pinibacter aurantiacus TaxID=2851599 RepID=A0A9E2W8V3_9BACT|nr:hypothetical protein [Pinibacter aurantiacus]MBV4359071.1 hypothetical protein [Pinibacter aurantiacus]
MFKVKRNQKPTSPLYPFWNSVVQVIQTRLKCLARWCEQKTRLWSKQRWQTVLIVFSTASFIISGWIIHTALVNTNEVISVQEIIKVPPMAPIERNTNNTRKTLLCLQQLKHNLDSLKESNKPGFEELIRREPHLLDSLNGLIELYTEQSK